MNASLKMNQNDKKNNNGHSSAAEGWRNAFKKIFINRAEWDQKGLNLALIRNVAPGDQVGVNVALDKNIAQFSQRGISIALYNYIHATGVGPLLRIGDSFDDAQQGINIALIRNSVAGRQIGVNIAGLSNHVEQDQIGLNVALFNSSSDQSGINIALVNDVSSGLFSIFKSGESCQEYINLALLMNNTQWQVGVNAAALNFVRHQIGLSLGLFNVSTFSQSGFSASALNWVSEEQKGVSVAAVNVTTNLDGVSVSLFSRIRGTLRGFAASLFVKAQEFCGVMMGIVTVVEDSGFSTGVQLGLLNIRKDKEKWYDKYRPFIAISLDR